MAELPEGYSIGDEGKTLPEGYSIGDEAPKKNLFTKIIGAITDETPEVPISPGSAIGMARAVYRGVPALKALFSGEAQYHPGGQVYDPASDQALQDAQGLLGFLGRGAPGVGRVAGRFTAEAARALDEAALARGIPRPAGRMVSPEEAGGVIAPKVQASPTPVPGLSGAEGNVATFDRLVNLGTGKNPAEISVIHRMRGSVPAEDWAKVQTAALDRYNDLSTAGKNAIFPDKELRTHLDNFFDVEARAPKWEALDAEKPGRLPSIPKKLYAVAGVTAMVSPSHALAMILGASGLKRALSQAPSAASAATWAKRYEGLVRRPSPGTLQAFTSASKSLSDTLGLDIPQEAFLKAAGTNVSDPNVEPTPDNPLAAITP